MVEESGASAGSAAMPKSSEDRPRDSYDTKSMSSVAATGGVVDMAAGSERLERWWRCGGAGCVGWCCGRTEAGAGKAGSGTGLPTGLVTDVMRCERRCIIDVSTSDSRCIRLACTVGRA